PGGAHGDRVLPGREGAGFPFLSVSSTQSGSTRRPGGVDRPARWGTEGPWAALLDGGCSARNEEVTVMQALVVFESAFGNTEKIARAIGEGLSLHMTSRVVEVGGVPSEIG